MANNLPVLWTGSDAVAIPSSAKAPAEIVGFARQLSLRDQRGIALNFQNENYDMAMSFVWQKSMAALKRELASVGMQFLGEILGKSDLDDDAKPTSAISDSEAIMLAEELGVVNGTDAIRLRHAHELIAHFIDVEGNATSDEDGQTMEEAEALQALKTCVKNILGKEKVQVSTEFSQFRSSLVSKSLKDGDPEIRNLSSSPYFFKKITIKVIVGGVRAHRGAPLENLLGNVNIIVPAIWSNLKDSERYALGSAYAQAFNDGEMTISAGLKRALLKVQGFDFVPENLRSQTFQKAATKLLEAHEGMNNFYNEPAPARELKALGTTIPIPVFHECATALLCVILGNPYGVSYDAAAVAKEVMAKFTNDRWEYYLSKCLPTDARILNKLAYGNPRAKFSEVVTQFELQELNLSGNVKKLMRAAADKDALKIEAAVSALRKEYYSKSQ